MLPHIRPATPADIPQILAFIRELALYEREPHAVLATEADLLRDGFGPTPRFRCVLAEVDSLPEDPCPFMTGLHPGMSGSQPEPPPASPSSSPPTAPGEATTASASKTSTSPPRPPGAGNRPRPPPAPSPDRRRRGLPPPRVGRPRLEHPRHRLLRADRRPHPHRVAHHAPRRPGPQSRPRRHARWFSYRKVCL